MTTAVLIVLLLAAFLVGCLAMRGDAASNPTPRVRPISDARAEATIDPNDDHQLGLLLSMTGGDVTDAATARSALRRFEQENGRRATHARRRRGRRADPRDAVIAHARRAIRPISPRDPFSWSDPHERDRR